MKLMRQNPTMGYQSNFIHTDTDEALESVLDF